MSKLDKCVVFDNNCQCSLDRATRRVLAQRDALHEVRQVSETIRHVCNARGGLYTQTSLCVVNAHHASAHGDAYMKMYLQVL